MFVCTWIYSLTHQILTLPADFLIEGNTFDFHIVNFSYLSVNTSSASSLWLI